MDKQTLDAYRQRRWEAHSLWLVSKYRDPVLEAQLWDAYVEAKRMHELAQDTYDAAQRQEQDHGHRDS